jgi:hypothetical protein
MRPSSSFALVIVLAACSSGASEPRPPRSHAASPAPATEAPVAEPPAQPPSSLPAPARIVAIGDVHGDLRALEHALELAGAIDAAHHWTGGTMWVVQNGDLLDRGDQEAEILDLVAQLEVEAAAAGGRFVALDGNHEVMNTQGDFRYVTPGGFAEFASYAEHASAAQRRRYRDVPREALGRAVAFGPGGPRARELATRNVAMVIGDTVFVHGGITAEAAARGLDAINHAARAFFLGASPLPEWLAAEDSPIWHRGFATAGDPATCAALDAALTRLSARRMVVGHTVQEHGVTSACGDRVWRVDVGLARYYGGPNEVLEITGESARVLR